MADRTQQDDKPGTVEIVEGIVDDSDTLKDIVQDTNTSDMKNEIDGVHVGTATNNPGDDAIKEVQGVMEKTVSAEAEDLKEMVEEKIEGIASDTANAAQVHVDEVSGEVAETVENFEKDIKDQIVDEQNHVEETLNNVSTNVLVAASEVAEDQNNAVENVGKHIEEMPTPESVVPQVETLVIEQTEVDNSEEKEEEASEEDKEQPKLIDPTIEAVKDGFKLFDYSHDGTISVEDVGNCLRCLGMNPTLAQVEHVVGQLALNDEGRVEFRKFVGRAKELIESGMYKPLPEEKLLEAFQILDRKGTGYLTAKQMRSIMTQIGEPLSDMEMEAMLGESSDKDGHVEYVSYVKKL